MRGYSATIHEHEGFKYFVCDDEDTAKSKSLPSCIVDSDFDTFNFFTQKPELPYTVGSCLKAHPHTPQPPDNDNFPGYEFNYSHNSEKNTVRPFQRCLLHPPWPGKTESGVVEFKIVDWMQAGDPNDAQVVAIRILNSTVDLPTDMDILAKIYDPLYFNHIPNNVDIFRYTDYCYRRESAAYKHLADLQGNIIPKYYGSFTISLPGDGNISRDVRMILLEIVPGPSMDKLDPSSLKQSERQEIMKAVVDSDRAVYARKVTNRDVSPRNILLPLKQPHRDRRAVMVDFGISCISPDLDDKNLAGLAHPPKRLYFFDTYNFWEWIDWDWDEWIHEQYGHIKGSSLTLREKYVIHDAINEAC